MAELQLLTALLTMYKSIGDILEAAQHEGGTIDVFEIQVAHELVNVEWARLLARPTPDAPTPTSRKRKGAPPTSDVVASPTKLLRCISAQSTGQLHAQVYRRRCWLLLGAGSCWAIC